MQQEDIEMIPIQQNNVSNNILRDLNLIRDIKESEHNIYDEYTLETDHGKLSIRLDQSGFKQLKNKLKYPIIKKLFLYIGHLLNRERQLDLAVDTTEFLELIDNKVRTENKNKVKEHLLAMRDIKIVNYDYKTRNEVEKLSESKLLNLKESNNGNDLINITVGNWATKLVENNHYAYIPKKIFEFKKLELDIAYNILLRHINEYSHLEERGYSFALSTKYLMKNIESNERRYGSGKVIERVEEVLDKLEKAGWFEWSYRNFTKTDLPQRNKLRKYFRVMVDFDCENSCLIKK